MACAPKIEKREFSDMLDINVISLIANAIGISELISIQLYKTFQI